jgi:VanZ family protein
MRRGGIAVSGGSESKMPITENESEKEKFDWLTWAIGFLCGVVTMLVLVPHPGGSAAVECWANDRRGMNADMKSRFRASAKVCSGAIMVLLVIAALGPAKWAPRTELGWQFDHFIGYFGITLFVCLAWPRPFVEVIMAVAALLESLQALTPDRSANLEAALWGAAGALAAALVSELLIRAWKWRLKRARAGK